MTASGRRFKLSVCLLLSLAMAGCGTRLTREQILATNEIRGGSAAQAGSGNPSSAGGAGSSVVSATTQPGAAAGGSSAGGGGSVAGGGVVGSGASAGARAAGGAASGAPITVGLLSNETGIGANVTVPVREVWQAWAKSVNARGGVNGHPINLVIDDCANNTSLNVPDARDLVEKQGAIALAFECSEVAGLPEYAQQMHVPVVGSLMTYPDWNTNPYMFPTGPNGDGGAKGHGLATKQLGVTKVGILYCVESPACKGGADKYAAAATANGLQVVYESGTTVTQPDYTSECLSARSAGAQDLYNGGLPDEAIRIARSCVRQGYKPIFDIAPAADTQGQVPELDGAVTMSNSFPWMLRSGSPALNEYGQALAKYAPDLLTNGTSLQTDGWVAGKTLERAIQLGVAANNPKPTKDDILNGLWQMKGETLGGLEPGPMARTFTRNQPTPDVACTFVSVLRGGKWSAPSGAQPVCA